MLIVDRFKNEQVIVLGLGITGVSAVISLLKGGARVIVVDNKVADINIHYDDYRSLVNSSFNNKTLILNPTGIDWLSAKALVVSPGIPLEHPFLEKAKEHDVEITSDIELMSELAPYANMIGITGTNGKSTTTSLINHIFLGLRQDVRMGGNIGVPVLSFDVKNQGIGQTYVLETSSFQLDLISKVRFNTAVFLNIMPDHLDRHKTMEAYKGAKMKIFENQREGDYAVISVDSPAMISIYQELKSRNHQTVIPVSTEKRLEEGVSIIAGRLYDRTNEREELEFDLSDMKYLRGKHNAENIAAGYVAARLNKLVPSRIVEAIKSFKGLKHRMELVLEKGKLSFINDSKATNSSAVEKALATFDDIIWIAGGICKDDGIECLSHLFHRLKHVYLIGSAQDKFAAVLNKYNIPFTKAGELAKALRHISETAVKEGVVLLSPACASLDQWKNYEERGNAFVDMVKINFAS